MIGRLARLADLDERDAMRRPQTLIALRQAVEISLLAAHEYWLHPAHDLTDSSLDDAAGARIGATAVEAWHGEERRAKAQRLGLADMSVLGDALATAAGASEAEVERGMESVFEAMESLASVDISP